ncbi:MAG TPA: translational GTPase TypA [Candidatus Binataceae bacterium]|nr:translational GTPase TypA [Candidatus Binataceae bacterium]
MRRQDIRNLAIVAHVDHGKTTLVDALLRQSGVFRANEHVAERVMDSFALERERGITIMAKNTSIAWHDVRINIVDTPGHSDFGGEVERTLAMVDGILLLVDASEGPLPQTRFVLRKALEAGLAVVLCINKIDRADARVAEVLDEVYDLFIDLGANEDQLDFPILYTNARAGVALTRADGTGPEGMSKDLAPLFEAIVSHLPGPEVDPEAPLQFQANNIDYDEYVGRLAIGRVVAGTIKAGGTYALYRTDGSRETCKVAHLYGWRGLKRAELLAAEAGDVVMVAGLEDIEIGETITDPENPRPLPGIRIDEPTVAMTFSVNNAPWAGREGQFVTSRKLGARIELESRRNVSIRVDQSGADSWRVLGRGELALAVIVETMRREGYELQVSKPTVVTRSSGGELLEPMEFLVIDIPEEHIGLVTQLLSARKGRMRTMTTHQSGRVRLEYDVPARGLIGFRGRFLADTRGTGVMHSVFNGYAPWCGAIRSRQNGAMISDREGIATPYAIFHLQERGIFFIPSSEPVYEGMILGEYARETNLPVNVCREKKLTNIRASGHDEAVRLSPPRLMTLDTALEWIDEEELVELTPRSVRLRNRVLKTGLRGKHRAGWLETAGAGAAEAAESE